MKAGVEAAAAAEGIAAADESDFHGGRVTPLMESTCAGMGRRRATVGSIFARARPSIFRLRESLPQQGPCRKMPVFHPGRGSRRQAPPSLPWEGRGTVRLRKDLGAGIT